MVSDDVLAVKAFLPTKGNDLTTPNRTISHGENLNSELTFTIIHTDKRLSLYFTKLDDSDQLKIYAKDMEPEPEMPTIDLELLQ